jgi:hypothetical protein
MGLGHACPMRRRTCLRIVTFGSFLTGLLGSFTVPSQADCAAPEVQVPRVAGAGETMTVKGGGWAPCDDTCGGCIGCGTEPGPPLGDLDIALRPVGGSGLTEVMLVTGVGANEKFRLDHSITLPADIESGRYVIVVGRDGDWRAESRPIEVRSQFP